MILERILKKFSNTKNNGYCTTRKKGTLPFFYNVLQEFTEKLKILYIIFVFKSINFKNFSFNIVVYLILCYIIYVLFWTVSSVGRATDS